MQATADHPRGAPPPGAPPRGSRRWVRVLLLLALLVVLALAAAAALAWRRELPATEPPPAGSFDRQLVQRGSQLASAGNCLACHTAPGGQPFAGGLAMSTPFGTIYSTNITPDPDTGIGRWSQQAFDRSMREGVDRRGSHLYPAFPYTHFARVTDEDLRALYAYLMTRTPVQAQAPANELVFPLGFRPLLAGWKMLFLERGVYRPDPAQSPEWNRGAYLAQGLGHCSACHSPRNALGAERRGEHLGGGLSQGWYAPALDASAESPLPWTVAHLTEYLRTGIAPNHPIAAGPMQDVVRSLARVPEEDVRAIAVYIHATLGPANAAKEAQAQANLERAWSVVPAQGRDADPAMQLGASVYRTACAGCHAVGRELSSGTALQLPLATALYAPTPASLIRIVREGIRPPEGEPGRWMPGFAGALTDEQMTALLQYLRRAAADAPPWDDLAGEVRKARQP